VTPEAKVVEIVKRSELFKTWLWPWLWNKSALYCSPGVQHTQRLLRPKLWRLWKAGTFYDLAWTIICHHRICLCLCLCLCLSMSIYVYVYVYVTLVEPVGSLINPCYLPGIEYVWWGIICTFTATKTQFMYSFSGNCAASVPISTFVCLWAIYMYISCSRIGREYINRSQTHINVKIGTVAEQFRYYFCIFGTGSLKCGRDDLKLNIFGW
jgi:hypothetical protein